MAEVSSPPGQNNNKFFSAQLRSVQAMMYRYELPPASQGHPLKPKTEEQSTPVRLFLTPASHHSCHLLLLAGDLVRADDGGEVVARKVEQLIALKHLPWVRHNVAPSLLVQLLQEEILGREPEVDGIGAIQLSSQPLRTSSTQILLFRSHLLAILAESFDLQVLSCLHHLHDVLLLHLHLLPHHTGEHQGQPLRRA